MLHVEMVVDMHCLLPHPHGQMYADSEKQYREERRTTSRRASTKKNIIAGKNNNREVNGKEKLNREARSKKSQQQGSKN